MMFLRINLILQILNGVLNVYGELDVISKLYQSDYHMIELRADGSYVNKDYMHTANMIGHKFNRTTVAFNFTFWPKIDLQDKVQVVVQAYKRASNEYRLFPLRFQMNKCKMINSNVMGLRNISQYGNYSRCFWKKDVLYYANNVGIDDSHAPPLLPTGEYNIQSELMFDKIKLTTGNFYFQVVYKNTRNWPR